MAEAAIEEELIAEVEELHQGSGPTAKLPEDTGVPVYGIGWMKKPKYDHAKKQRTKGQHGRAERS